jgi:hypothetical protein
MPEFSHIYIGEKLRLTKNSSLLYGICIGPSTSKGGESFKMSTSPNEMTIGNSSSIFSPGIYLMMGLSVYGNRISVPVYFLPDNMMQWNKTLLIFGLYFAHKCLLFAYEKIKNIFTKEDFTIKSFAEFNQKNQQSMLLSEKFKQWREKDTNYNHLNETKYFILKR